jgi:hypothetical protein
VPTVFLQHTRVSSGGLARKQESPKVRGGVGLANQFSSIVFSHKSTASSNSYSSPIVQARPQHTSKKAPEPSYRASSDPFARTSSPWQGRLSPPRITVRNIPSVILHPLNSRQASSSPRNLVSVELFSSLILFTVGIHFSPFSFTTKAIPRFALIH